MKKTLGWIALMVSAAVMVSPAVAQERNTVDNNFGHGSAPTVYNSSRSYNRGTQPVYNPIVSNDSNYRGTQTANFYGDRENAGYRDARSTDRDDDRRVSDRDDDRGHYRVQYRQDNDRDRDDFHR